MTQHILLLAVLIGGCDLFHDEAPSTFEATYEGARSGTLRGTGTAAPRPYCGLGCGGNIYQVWLDATPEGAPAGSGGSVQLGTQGLSRPAGTYSIGAPSFAFAGFTLPDSVGPDVVLRQYIARSGTIRIEAGDGGRLTGSIHITDSFQWWGSDPDAPVDTTAVLIEGTFDIEPRDE